jgi:hypothetical protein
MSDQVLTCLPQAKRVKLVALLHAVKVLAVLGQTQYCCSCVCRHHVENISYRIVTMCLGEVDLEQNDRKAYIWNRDERGWGVDEQDSYAVAYCLR